MKILHFFESFKKTVISVAVMALAVVVVLLITTSVENSLLRLIMMIISGILAYSLASWFINREKLLNIKNIFSEYFKSLNA